MNPEYVRFKKNEEIQIEKNLLKSQLMLLDSIKKYNIFKKLKMEKLLLKIALKTKIEHLNNDINYLERLMPKPTIKPKNIKYYIEEEKDYTLEEEIDLIKKKLEELNS